jgi:tetratricopeptide (TPR) repeat protein
MYYYLGLAYEYHGEPEKAKIQYAIAYRLTPDADEVQRAFRRTWHIKPK